MKKPINAVVAFAVGFIACAVVLKALYGAPISLLPTAPSAASKQAVLTTLNASPTPEQHFVGDSVVADAAAKIDPAIVEIHTTGNPVHMRGFQNPFENDPMFRQLFPFPQDQGQTYTPQGAGSGIIISPDGYIITNDHVVNDAAKLVVEVGDGDKSDKTYNGTVVGTDPVTDIAVVKITPQAGQVFPVAQLGDSSDLRIGDWAIAVGDPLDVGKTVTLGIISALNRSGLQAEDHPLQSLIQTDAAINPGNSGGALANIDGQVIGINEAIESPTGYYSGIGFAIPINRAKTIAAELIKNGKIDRPSVPYLGIEYGPLSRYTPDARQELGIPSSINYGAVVAQVYPGSPADKAGIQVYDVILEVNRQKLTDINQLANLVKSSKVGDTLTLLVCRNGQNEIVTVTLAAKPNDFGEQMEQQPFGFGQPGGGGFGQPDGGGITIVPGDQ